MEEHEPELGGFWFVFVAKWLLNIISRVKFGGFHDWSFRLRGWIEAGERTSIFGLDGPESLLVVHRGLGVFSDTPDQFGVSGDSGCFCGFLCWCHCCCWFWCFFPQKNPNFVKRVSVQAIYIFSLFRSFPFPARISNQASF